MGTAFLSYRRTEQADADRLQERLEGRWRLSVHPVALDAADTWQAACRRLIDQADAVVAIVGDTTAPSRAVDWELETAIALGRPIVAVRAERAAAPRLPARLAARGIALHEPGDVLRRLEEVVLDRAG